MAYWFRWSWFLNLMSCTYPFMWSSLIWWASTLDVWGSFKNILVSTMMLLWLVGACKLASIKCVYPLIYFGCLLSDVWHVSFSLWYISQDTFLTVFWVWQYNMSLSGQAWTSCRRAPSWCYQRYTSYCNLVKYCVLAHCTDIKKKFLNNDQAFVLLMIWTLHWPVTGDGSYLKMALIAQFLAIGCSTYCFQAIWWMTNLMIINGMFLFLFFMNYWIKMQWCNSNYNEVHSFWMVSRVFYSKLALLCFIMAEELYLNHAVVQVTMKSSTYSLHNDLSFSNISCLMGGHFFCWPFQMVSLPL